MNAITLAIESSLTKDAAKLIEGSEAALRAVYRPDECFSFTASELDKPEISFIVARETGRAVGCVALVDYGDYGEIKRLYVPKAERGKGLARILMAELERRAAASGAKSVKLETGDKLEAAVALYKKLGYAVCGPFGEYDDHPASLFMTKDL